MQYLFGLSLHHVVISFSLFPAQASVASADATFSFLLWAMSVKSMASAPWSYPIASRCFQKPYSHLCSRVNQSWIHGRTYQSQRLSLTFMDAFPEFCQFASWLVDQDLDAGSICGVTCAAEVIIPFVLAECDRIPFSSFSPQFCYLWMAALLLYIMTASFFSSSSSLVYHHLPVSQFFFALPIAHKLNRKRPRLDPCWIALVARYFLHCFAVRNHSWCMHFCSTWESNTFPHPAGNFK